MKVVKAREAQIIIKVPYEHKQHLKVLCVEEDLTMKAFWLAAAEMYCHELERRKLERASSKTA